MNVPVEERRPSVTVDVSKFVPLANVKFILFGDTKKTLRISKKAGLYESESGVR